MSLRYNNIFQICNFNIWRGHPMKSMLNKALVLAVIVLFAGVGVVPSIGIESWQTKTKYVETRKA